MKNKIFYLSLLCTLMLAQGCIVKKYERPELPVEANYRASVQNDSTDIATIKWDEYFQDTLLLALIRQGIANNLDLQVAESRITSAMAYFKQSRAAFYPSLSVGGQVGINRLSDNSFQGALSPDPLRDWTAQFSSSWEIDIWGKLRAARNAQKASLYQSQAYKDAVQTQLVAGIAAAYYNLVSLDAVLAVMENSVITRGESLQIIKSLKESGKENEVSVNQAAAQLYYAMVNVPQTKMNIEMAENGLAVLLGTTPREINRGNILDGNQITKVDILDVGVPVQLLENRPDVRQAEFALMSAHQNLNVARASLYPSLTISGAAGFNATDFTNWFIAPASIFANVLGGLTQPIFNNGKLKAQKRVAEQNRIQSVLAFKNTMLTAQKEVANALITYRMTKESINYQQMQVDELNKAVNGSFLLLKNGYVTYLDLLYAQDNALSAQQALINLYLQNTQSRVDLYRALGGGWR